jgi:hypothetical protein
MGAFEFYKLQKTTEEELFRRSVQYAHVDAFQFAKKVLILGNLIYQICLVFKAP